MFDKERRNTLKQFKFTLVIMAAFLITLGLSATADAYHDGGVATCGGCHSMHSAATPATASQSFLLKGVDFSSTCLNCHEGSAGSYHISTADAAMPEGSAPVQRTPGGDFGWLKKTYSWTGRSGTSYEYGETHGHNIVAATYGYTADSRRATSPGGTFPANELGCTSCHDPHGKRRRLSTGNIASTGAPIIDHGSYSNDPVPVAGEAVGVYRLLRGTAYGSDANFTGNPAAVTPSSYNRTEATTQTRVVYGSYEAAGSGYVKWGTWCATCHGDMHSGGGNYVHPTDQNLGATIADIYGDYVKTGDMTGDGTQAYLTLVPFMNNGGDFATLAALASTDNSTLGGPASTDQVSCLSCHRAHASGWPNMLRWDGETEFVTEGGSWPTARGRTEAETQAAYYDRPASTFATYQRPLCNKCHAQD
jgi:predicted CXXCH cytochrome family protein